MDEAIDITPEDSLGQVFLVPLTEDEIAEREEAAMVEKTIEEIEAEKQAAKDSAILKLTKIGLTEEEAKAIVGI